MGSTAVILKQICLMFAYMAIGWRMFRSNLITKEGSKALSHLLLYVILPCAIIKSFCIEPTAENIKLIGISFAAALLSLGIAIIISYQLFKERPVDNFGAAFSNAGFIGIPLISETLGNQVLICVAALIALLNVLQWTYGQFILSGDKTAVSPKAVISSPLLLSLVCGLILFYIHPPIPELMFGYMNTIGQMNAPVAMLVLGVYLGELKIEEIICEPRAWFCSLIRLAIIPAVTAVLTAVLFSEYEELAKAVLIASAAPVGANVAVYSQKLEKDYKYAVKIVCLSTLLSVFTIPAILILYERLVIVF